MSAAAILEAHDLTRQYRIGRGLLGQPAILRAVDGVSLSLRPGATLAVVNARVRAREFDRRLMGLHPAVAEEGLVGERDLAQLSREL